MAAASLPTDADARAAEAERSVGVLFGTRLLGMPFTHLAHVAHPAPRFVGGSWNYWWQAHYLDAIVDAGRRLLRTGDRQGAFEHVRLGNRLVATIRVRNVGMFTNRYYDDMAWLALAVDRLRVLTGLAGDHRPPRRLRAADLALTARLRSAITDDLGGGLFWNTTRDFKNVPATGPAALHLARGGDLETARLLVDWVYARLLAPDTGLFLDGIRVTAEGEHVVTDVYTYNQGTMLGALLALGDDTSLKRADRLVNAIATHLTTPNGHRRPLITHGGGDGGLFTGILVRYLALAAGETSLDAESRSTARRLVLDTADCFWVGRDERTLVGGQWASVFAPDPIRAAVEAGPGGQVIELSTQVQAWMTLEAAGTLLA
ncbi:MAG: glycosyl hydrolase [Humibacillus sp.]|nr:glycosyl hydrolase [Humibacillus sp.]MDN5779249.1 glycosyl hydrolase [Humibacillus sp.]